MGFLSGVSSFIEKHSEAVYAVLDVAGFIPVAGAVADIANTALYIHEGDVGNAIMCGIAAIPGIGDLASLARKSYNAFKTSKTGIKVMNALKKYKGVEKILSSLRGKMKTGARGLSKLSEGFGKLFDRIKNLLKGGCMDGRCFTGDTLVLTKHGYTAIKEIQKGDEILSRDEKTGRTGFKEVEDVFIRTVHTIYHVWLDGKEEIKTTAYHPVYVQEQGWVTAINLREGDTLETMEGTACITKIVKERHEEPVTVYNLAVKDWVSYFVGKVRVYAHNGIGYDGDIASKIKDIQNKMPEQLIADGWKDVTNIELARNTNSREFYDPKSGMKLRFDKGVKGAKGFEAVDHYHIFNPNHTTKKSPLYLDINGNPVYRGSKKSHIVIKGGN